MIKYLNGSVTKVVYNQLIDNPSMFEKKFETMGEAINTNIDYETCVTAFKNNSKLTHITKYEKITGNVNAIYSNAINMTSCLFNYIIYLCHKQVQHHVYCVSHLTFLRKQF